nr:MAG TPA: hypothetical protein [Caudoviricetes sp.]
MWKLSEVKKIPTNEKSIDCNNAIYDEMYTSH